MMGKVVAVIGWAVGVWCYIGIPILFIIIE